MNLEAKTSTLSIHSDKEYLNIENDRKKLETRFGPKINLIYNSNTVFSSNNENNIYTGISARKTNEKFHLKVVKEKSQLDTNLSKKRNSYIIPPSSVPASVKKKFIS